MVVAGTPLLAVPTVATSSILSMTKGQTGRSCCPYNRKISVSHLVSASAYLPFSRGAFNLFLVCRRFCQKRHHYRGVSIIGREHTTRRHARAQTCKGQSPIFGFCTTARNVMEKFATIATATEWSFTTSGLDPTHDSPSQSLRGCRSRG